MKTLLATTFILCISFISFSQTAGAGVTDIDGNSYETVIIGTQEWMAENLRVTKYKNGDPIPNITDNTQWGNLTSGAWSHYNNDSQYENLYGKLYNWHVMGYDGELVCPSGWHVPSGDDWFDLFYPLGGTAIAGGKMKSIGTQYWNSPNTDATNESGFSALPAGYRDGWGGSFSGMGNEATFWESNAGSTGYYHSVITYHGGVNNGVYLLRQGRSIRCIKDSAPLGVIELNPEPKQLLKITDLMGREVEETTNTVLIYIYTDGTIERKYIIE